MSRWTVLLVPGLAWLFSTAAAAEVGAEAAARGAGREAFEEGIRAVRGGDLGTALGKLEAALAADPDNLRYGSEYRQAVISAEAFDRCLEFFEGLVADHPEAANARLNLGFAYIDKSPDEGAVTQVLLANKALQHFGAALEIEETWLALFTRGNSYLYWPPILGRTKYGIADLEKAIALAERVPRRGYHVRAHTALGDGHFRLGDLDRARQAWRQGLERFPGDPDLERRLALGRDGLEALIEDVYATDRRVDTDLALIWAGE